MNMGKRILLLTLALCLALLPAFTRAAGVLSYGSRGDKVKELQQKLRRWGYYTHSVDGIFGYETYTSVKYFQRRNGLTADGVVGAQTAKALGMSLTGGSATGSSSGSTGGSSGSGSSGDVYLLARCIYAESRGEPYTGQVAVAAVVLNRVESSHFPNSVAGVIYQSGAFTAVSDGQINLSPDQNALKAARDAMNGWDPTNGCLYYYNPSTATSSWIRTRPVLLSIGEHVFCK